MNTATLLKSIDAGIDALTLCVQGVEEKNVRIANQLEKINASSERIETHLIQSVSLITELLVTLARKGAK